MLDFIVMTHLWLIWTIWRHLSSCLRLQNTEGYIPTEWCLTILPVGQYSYQPKYCNGSYTRTWTVEETPNLTVENLPMDIQECVNEKKGHINDAKHHWMTIIHHTITWRLHHLEGAVPEEDEYLFKTTLPTLQNIFQLCKIVAESGSYWHALWKVLHGIAR